MSAIRLQPCAVRSLDTISDCAENLTERDELLAQLGLLAGDLDGDGGVAFADFLKLADSFGEDGQTLHRWRY